MKKLMYLLGIVLVVIGLTACTSENEAYMPTENNAQHQNDITEPEEETNEPTEEPLPTVVLGTFTIHKVENPYFYEWGGDSSGLISLEAAAEIGANYIFEVLQQSLDGMYLMMMLNYNHNISHSTWHGWVAQVPIDNPGQFGGEPHLFFFMIDATTGMRLSLMNNDRRDNAESGGMNFELPVLSATEIAEFEAVARMFAELHFENTNVIHVELGYFGQTHAPVLDGSAIISFFAVDDNEMAIDLMFNKITGDLWMISTPATFFLPDNFNFTSDSTQGN